MKERIKELAEQATTIEEHGWGVSYKNFDREKFAKLLLGEFIEALEESNRAVDIRDAASAYGLSILVGDIKQHFGVE